MAKHKGRPKKKSHRDKSMGLFVTWNQYFIILQKANQTGLGPSEYLRQMAIIGKAPTHWSEEDGQIIKKLISLSYNLDQPATIARKEKMSELSSTFNTGQDSNGMG